MIEVPYMELWKRLDRVVVELTRAGDSDTADYLAVGFFLRYPDPKELRRFVEIAEESLEASSVGDSRDT